MENCETCLYYNYDDEMDMYVCDRDMDEDEYADYLMRKHKTCPFYRDGDEYKTARKQ